MLVSTVAPGEDGAAPGIGAAAGVDAGVVPTAGSVTMSMLRP